MTAGFRAYQRPPAHVGATVEADGARLQGHLKLTVQDDAGGSETPEISFALAGPGDVLGLDPRAVVKRYPAPGIADAEATKAPFVELQPAELPWKYTARTPDGSGLRPWLVLVVGPADQLRIDAAGRIRIPASVGANHTLTKSGRWVHTQAYAGNDVARVLSPVPLGPATRYLAVLVPAFRLDGTRLVDAWDGASDSQPLPVLDSWAFSTAEDFDDFQSIAKRLEPLSDAEWQQLRGAKFGGATVRYPRAREPRPDELPVLAALTLVPREGEQAADAVDPAAPILDDLKQLSTPPAVPPRLAKRWVLTLPRYDDPWPLPPSAAGIGTRGWIAELADDPRRRGVAGLGSWAAIEWQDRISDAAAAQAGALAAAAERVRHLVLGLAAARSLWNRRVPADPTERLAFLGPVLAKLPSDTGGSVLDALSGRIPSLAAVRSGAARRALRHGTTIGRLAAPGALEPASIVGAANRCPPAPPRAGPDVIVDHIPETEALDPEGFLDESTGPLDTHPVVTAQDEGLRGNDAIRAVHDLRRILEPDEPEPDTCKPIVKPQDLGTLVATACDPNAAQPAALVHVHGTVHGLPEPWLAPPDLSPELDLPLSVFLTERAPDWLLPGVGLLPVDRAVAVATNPVFVDALLVGANHRAIGELRWRNLPVVTGWTPLRRFWNRIHDPQTGSTGPLTDVDGIVNLDRLRAAVRADGSVDAGADWLRWPAGKRLGDPAHLSDPTAGSNLVVLFHTKLFHRYPSTVVRLVPAAPGPDWSVDPDFTKPVEPTFKGQIGADVVFFGFPVPPSEGRDHWVVLEEPPPGYHFWSSGRGDDHFTWTGNGADVAAGALVRPVRVLLGRLVGDGA